MSYLCLLLSRRGFRRKMLCCLLGIGGEALSSTENDIILKLEDGKG
jgi:hypothetical protein